MTVNGSLCYRRGKGVVAIGKISRTFLMKMPFCHSASLTGDVFWAEKMPGLKKKKHTGRV